MLYINKSSHSQLSSCRLLIKILSCLVSKFPDLAGFFFFFIFSFYWFYETVVLGLEIGHVLGESFQNVNRGLEMLSFFWKKLMKSKLSHGGLNLECSWIKSFVGTRSNSTHWPCHGTAFRMLYTTMQTLSYGLRNTIENPGHSPDLQIPVPPSGPAAYILVHPRGPTSMPRWI